jgi:hypothetical protein
MSHNTFHPQTHSAVHFPTPPAKPEEQPPPPEGESVYDTILPASISFRPPANKNKVEEEVLDAEAKMDPLDPPAAPEGVPVMPLVTFLQEGRSKEAGWHRNAERRSRGMFPHSSLSSQLEPWERQLVSTVIDDCTEAFLVGLEIMCFYSLHL